MLAYSRFQSRQSLNMAAQSNLLESAVFKTTQQNMENDQFRTSSHVNLFQISEYNNNSKARRQRPQTGKLRTTQTVQNQNPNILAPAQTGFKIIGPLHSQQSQYNGGKHRRLTSAKGDSRFRNKPGPESGLFNTRDVIQSFGHLTTMAGSNQDALSNNRMRKSQVHPTQPQQPIVKQHFQPNPASKRLLSAKPPRNAPSLVVTNRQSQQYQTKQCQTRPKSGVVTSKRPQTGRPRIQSSKNSNHHPVITHQQFQFEQPNLQNQIVVRKEIMLDANGQEIFADNMDLHQQTHGEPLNLAIETAHSALGHMPTMPLPVPQQNTVKSIASGATTTNATHRKQSNYNHSNKQTRRGNQRQNLNRTVYRLPSLSQCIENKILPRSSEYMRRLYSIALRNHETQVPNMAQRRQNNMRATSPDQTQENDTFMASPEVGAQNNKEIDAQDTALGILSNESAEGMLNRALNRTPTNERSNSNNRLRTARSQSLATLHVTNLQFPFDNMIHGGFSRTKQMELNLLPIKYAQKQEQQTSPKKRPQTAGRMRDQLQNIDLFNNKLISQVANQMSSPALMSSEKLPSSSQQQPNSSQTGQVPTSGDVSNLLLDDKSQQNQQPHLYKVLSTKGGQQQDGDVEPSLSSPRTQFANLMGQVQTGKAQIVMCVKPQQDSQAQKDKADAEAYSKLLQSGGTQIDSEIDKAALKNPVNMPQINNVDDQLGGGLTLRKGLQSSDNSVSQSASKPNSVLDESNEKGTGMSNFYRRSKDYGINSLSSREFGRPMHFQEKNGTQLVVQMSGQGITAKRLTSARPYEKGDTHSQGSRSSGTGRRKSKSKKGANKKLSSTHSLQIKMTKNNRQGSEQRSLNDTNRLDESDDVMVDDQGARIMENQRSGSLAIDSSSRQNSQISNQDLKQHLNSKSVRKAYPIKSNQNAKKRYSQPGEQDSQAVSLQSHSQNLMDTQMRLKQVYQDDQNQGKTNDQKVIHRIPLAQGQSVPSLNAQKSEPRHQVLVVTNDLSSMRQIVANQEASISNMSNPLNNLQLSTDKMQAIKVKSVVFDNQGNYQIREAERGYSAMELHTGASEYANSPHRHQLRQSGMINQQYSPSQRDQTQAPFTPNSARFERQQPQSDDETNLDEQDPMHLHKRFKVTMAIKRSRPNLKEGTNSQPVGGKPEPVQASMKGRKMRLQSADSKYEKPVNMRQKQKHLQIGQETLPQDVHIEMIREMLDTESGVHQLDHSKGTIQNYNVPPLALPVSDTNTEIIQLSRVPSSHRQNVSYSTTSLARVTLMQQQQLESQNILKSFNANNVRSNLKGQNANKLIQGVDIGEMTNGMIEINPNYAFQPVRQQNNQKKGQKMSYQNIGVAESIRSLEKILIGANNEDSQDENVLSGRDFAATLGKDFSFASQSASDDKILHLIQQKINPKLSDAVEKESKTNASSPSPLNIAENITVNQNGGNEEEVIQEIEEMSSQQSRSKISVSVQSLRKTVHQQSIISDTQIIKVEELPVRQSPLGASLGGPLGGPIEGNLGGNMSKKMSSHTVKSMISRNQAVSKTNIKSVYEAEALALKRGIISAYSKGESTIATQKRRDAQAQKTNSDLQHFLGKEKSQKEDSVRTSIHRKGDGGVTSLGSEKNKTTNFLQSKNYNSADSIQIENNNENTSIKKVREPLKGGEHNSQISLAQQSSFGINIVQFAQKKKLEERPRTTTPQDQRNSTKSNTQTLEGHQKKAHEILEAAKKLMNDAKVMKLDSEVVNIQLLELFKDKQDTKNLDQMMSNATLQLGTQTLSSGKRRGCLEIPFQISQTKINQNNKIIQQRKGDTGSIMTKKLSSSSIQHGRNDCVISITQSFAPVSIASPLSSGRQKQVMSNRGATFALKSVGASTNRASKWELPVFGGIISSRVGELIESSGTMRQLKEFSERINDSWEGKVQSDYIKTELGNSQRKVAAPIIDYSQNFMTQSKKIKDQGPEQHNKLVTPQIDSQKQPMSTRNRRPQTAGRYNNKKLNQTTTQIKSGQLTSLQSSSQANLTQKVREMMPKSGAAANNISQSSAMNAIAEKPNEHPEQPQWAIRHNLKSKFNMTTAAQQVKQAQKFFIECKDDPRNEQNISPHDRVATANLSSLTPISPGQKGSFNTKSPGQNSSDQNSAERRTSIAQRRIVNQLNNQKAQNISPRKKMMSMPIKSERDNVIEVVESQPSELIVQEKEGSVESNNSVSNDDFAHQYRGKSLDSVPFEFFTPQENQYSMEEQPGKKQVNNQSMQVSFPDEPTMDHAIDTDRILQQHQPKVQHEMQQNYNSPMAQLHSASQRNNGSSKEVIKKVSNQGYIRRSLAGDHLFSVTQINSNPSLKKLK